MGVAKVTDFGGGSGWEDSLQSSKENNLTPLDTCRRAGIDLLACTIQVFFIHDIHHEEKGGGTEQIERKKHK